MDLIFLLLQLAVFWVVMLCSNVIGYLCLGETCCLLKRDRVKRVGLDMDKDIE